MRTDRHIADIIEIFDQAKPAHDGPGAVLGDHVSADVRIAGHDGTNDRAERQPIAAQPIWIDVHLVLLNCATDARHLRDAGN